MKTGDIFEHIFQMTPEIYKGFIEIFQDRNPVHVNAAFARSLGFKDKIMHGNILGGFVSYFIGQLLPTKDIVIISQKIDFHNPFYMESKLAFKAELINLSESVRMGDFKFSFRDTNGKLVAKGNVHIKLN